MIFQNKEYTELTNYPSYYISKEWDLIRKTDKGFVICSQTPNSIQDPYWTVTVRNKNGKYVKRSMHRLMMKTFVPNPENKAHVNHKNGDKASRDLNNLEWATPKENAQHAYYTGLSSTKATDKEVHQYYLDGTYITSFKSDAEAERVTGIKKTNISKNTLKLRDHAGGYIWCRIKKEKIQPLNRKIVSHFKVTHKSGVTKKYKYIGFFRANPNPKKAHPILVKMGNLDTLQYNNFFIERIYYK